jgi:hypothetical protein
MSGALQPAPHEHPPNSYNLHSGIKLIVLSKIVLSKIV